MDSDKQEPSGNQAHDKIPLSGKQLDAAIQAMETPGFLMRLTAHIMKLARQKGFHSPFVDSMDLPGGKSAADLATDIVEKALDGSYTWDQEKFSNFQYFCLSRAESILSNWLRRAKWSHSMSPLPEMREDGDGLDRNLLNATEDSSDIYASLRICDGGRLGDRFLEDFALSLPENSDEQAIVMAVYDDRECADRKYCRGQLKLSEKSYDAAVKRIERKLPAFRVEWCRQNKVGPSDWKEAR